MAKVVDWSLNSDILRKRLLSLSKKNVIKACKFKNISFHKKDDKKHLINLIIQTINEEREVILNNNEERNNSSDNESIASNGTIIYDENETEADSEIALLSSVIPLSQSVTTNITHDNESMNVNELQKEDIPIEEINNYAKYQNYWIKPSDIPTFKPSINIINHYQQQKVNDNKWYELECVPFPIFNDMISINESEFIIAPTNNSDSVSHINVDSIMSYNIYEDKWTKLMSYPLSIKLLYHTAAYNKQTNILYIYDSQRKLILINLVNNTHRIVYNYINKSKAGIGAKGIIINNQFHVIGGYNNNKHLIYNDDTNQFDVFEVDVFKKYKEGFKSFELIYVKSKRMLLLFGGYRFDKEKSMNSVYMYTISENRWIQLNVVLPHDMCLFGIISIYDRYIVFFGSKYDYRKNIYIFDIKTNIFTECTIQSPLVHDSCKAVVMKDYLYSVLLIYGYIRKKLKLSRRPSHDVINTICSFYSIQYVHLIDNNSSEHWKMGLSHLLQETV